MPSAIKALKANLHERRTSKLKSNQKNKLQTEPRSAAVRSAFLQKHETPAQRAHRLRTETLLPELQRRHKAGGIIDRRIGENDPTLTPDERMLQRYAAEGQRKRKADVFNLEDEEAGGAEEVLTHMGRPLKQGNTGQQSAVVDDFEDGGFSASEADEGGKGELFSRSKRKLEDAIEQVTRRQEDEGRNGEPPSKKSKKEVMEEVIAKSKYHKQERQAAREEYDDKREEIDKELPNLLALLGGKSQRREPTVPGGTNGAKGVQVVAKESLKEDADQTYDQRMRQMMQDKRAAPTTRTKSAEEKAADEAARIQKLEENRQRRMRGEKELASEVGSDGDASGDEVQENIEEWGADEAAEFGLSMASSQKPHLDVEDEDDFLIEDDLIASGSEDDIDLFDSASDGESANGDNSEHPQNNAVEDDDDDAEFLSSVLPGATISGQLFEVSNVPNMYTIPQTQDDLSNRFANIPFESIPTTIQRIRALHAPSLATGNKDKLASFGCLLVDHLPSLTSRHAPLPIIEQTIRHIHSLGRSSPLEIGHAFRRHLTRMHEAAQSSTGTGTWLEAGDLTLLTAISTIFPTSDHFHQVVTPAITIIARWLGTTTPSSLHNARTSLKGAYLVTLAARYQSQAKRYIPETIRFTIAALNAITQTSTPPSATAISQHISNLRLLSDLWSNKSAFIDIFTPALTPLHNLTTHPSPSISAPAQSTHAHLQTLIQTSRLHRRNLELHHHPPRPIRTALPLFETAFNPTKHYDPDPARAETAKLRKAHKQEKKAAMRELRRDAEFVARQRLVEKKERDRAYEEKFRRIIGGIQREEGEAGKEYERERERRRREKGRGR